MAKDYNNTLNLPKTEFPMRAGLPKSEPLMLKNWEDNNIHKKLMKKNEGKPLYVLHDGPPYANGSIHMGHALNKVLKDIIVRYKNMSGFKSPFVPGWDTHGLPTELKARAKEGVKNSESVNDVELRELCEEFVKGYIDEQREGFKRLGVIGDWDNPYITMQKAFEATQIEVFADMADKGYIYRGLKPVYWCPECKTALAEAEIEYSQDKCHSIYVKFRVTDDKGRLESLGADINKTYFVIWTTTTWTLPGNVAICVGSSFNYALIKCNDEYYVMAEELYKKAMEIAGLEDYEVLGTIKGADLEYMKTQHPFLDRESLVIVGNHVTLESGTGCVHTAPGHGIEDFGVCQNYPELSMVVPVDASGYLTEEAGQFSGLSIEKAGKPIADYLDSIGALFALQKIEHQYPHCWRCKEPVLFRATEQWFCSVDAFKDKAIEEIKKVRWIPDWGEDRIISMVKERKDWCISRQRKWGVPIPIFFCSQCGEPLIDKSVMLSVADVFREEGSNAWFLKEASEFLPKNITCKKCGGHKFIKEKDIMDVWFDSGVSHTAVCKNRPELHWPADLYLEGSDQYRGWFQSSLLTSVATTGKAPYKAVVTHGWVVDGEGKKQSKSEGNGIEPQTIIDQYGADILRLWVASADYHADVRISQEILKQLSESYRKIRNTARYILGNLYDFDPNENMVSLDDLLPLDKWAIDKLNNVIAKAHSGYENFEFHQVYHSIHNFCVVDLSNFYLDVLKDRLYVEKKDSTSRRAAQTAIYIILDSLVRLLGPILAFTSDEIWHYMPHKKTDNTEYVLFNEIPKGIDLKVDDKFIKMWDQLENVREDVKKALEIARKEKVIGSSLDAKVELHCEDELYDFIKPLINSLKEIFIVSQVEVINDNNGEFKGEMIKGLSVNVLHASGEKCERCWTYSETVLKNEEKICERCAKIVSSK
ncbi:MAG: Isoleucine--tRNA ligase [Eubacteriales bacterium SKADARSKE-1]|nr:Isoleucine--tRNA ligase [Eubacteriales bacterium SKADARSKE-1]